jgi:hypothetical protein
VQLQFEAAGALEAHINAFSGIVRLTFAAPGISAMMAGV